MLLRLYGIMCLIKVILTSVIARIMPKVNVIITRNGQIDSLATNRANINIFMGIDPSEGIHGEYQVSQSLLVTHDVTITWSYRDDGDDIPTITAI